MIFTVSCNFSTPHFRQIVVLHTVTKILNTFLLWMSTYNLLGLFEQIWHSLTPVRVQNIAISPSINITGRSLSPGFIYSETEAYKRHITYESAKLNVCPMSLAQQVTRSSLFSAEYVCLKLSTSLSVSNYLLYSSVKSIKFSHFSSLIRNNQKFWNSQHTSWDSVTRRNSIRLSQIVKRHSVTAYTTPMSL